MKKWRIIRLQEDTAEELKELVRFAESYDKAVRELLKLKRNIKWD